jgi:dTDP-4-dehydrorhamnose reductase
MKPRVLVTGATGHLGQGLMRGLDGRHDLTPLGFSRGAGPDLRDREAVRALASRGEFDTIVHLAGTKDLSACEADPRHAWELNVLPLVHLAEAFPKAWLILISTDYVFAGDRGGYTESDAPAPGTAYGRAKAAAEFAGALFAPCFTVIRLSALYDRQATFPRFLEAELSAGRPVEAYIDAFYTPTWHEDFCAILDRLLGLDVPAQGVFHVCGPRISRYAFAHFYAEARGFDPALIRAAKRGADSRLLPDLSLDCQETCARFGFTITPHAEAIARLCRSFQSA